MRVYVRRVDPAGDEADLAAVLPVIRAAYADFSPGEPPPCGQRVRHWTGEAYGSARVNFAAFADEADATAVGVTMATQQGTDFLGTWAFVDPAAAGPQISAALLQSVYGYCRAQGIAAMTVNTARAADAARYAPQRIGEPSFVGVRAELDLAAVDRAEMAALSEPSTANAGYRLVDWVDTCPDELAAAYCAALAAMNDAPAVAPDQPSVLHDLERMRADEQSSARYGVRRLVTAALAADGAIGGFTMTETFPEQPEFAEIRDTGVARDHRGRGLGVRLKAAATLRLLREHPAAAGLYTFTATDNAPMRAVNRRIGYRPATTWEIFRHEVPAAPAA